MKKRFKKSATKGSKVNEQKKASSEVDFMYKHGNELGDTIITAIALVVKGRNGAGIAAVGLAKAVATLKVVASRIDASIDTLFPNWSVILKRNFKN